MSWFRLAANLQEVRSVGRDFRPLHHHRDHFRDPVFNQQRFISPQFGLYYLAQKYIATRLHKSTF